MSEMPAAQKCGSASAPWICLANSGANVPCTADVCTPAFSKTRPCSKPILPPPPSAPEASLRCQGVMVKRPGAISAAANGPAQSCSSASKAAQILRCNASNQACASAFCCSIAFVSCRHPVFKSSLPICLTASPSTMAAATATFRERNGGRIEMRTLASTAARTSSGTPANSRPTSRISPGA